ncbi:MAG: hypothetical protein Q9184_001355 [Pyrenodesmia sp. 2 TL-2023]
MTLANDASVYPNNRTDTIQDSHKNHDAQSERQTAPQAVRPRNISNLLHLWESKGGPEDVLSVPQASMAASVRNNPSEAKERPLRKVNAPRMAFTTAEAHVTRSPNHSPQPINTMLSRSSTLLNVELAMKPQQYATIASLPDRNPGTISMKSVENAELGNGAKGSARLDEPPTAARFLEAQYDPDREIASFPPTDEGSRDRGTRLEGGIRAGYSSSDDVNTLSRRGRSMSRQGRFAGSSAARHGDNIQPLTERRSGLRDRQAYHTNTSMPRDTPQTRGNHQLSTSTSSTAALARSPSPLMLGHHHTCLVPGSFYRRATGVVSNSAGTCLSSPSARKWRWWKTPQDDVHVDPASKQEGAEQEHPHDPLNHTNSTSSSQYYSYEQSKLGNAELHDVSPIARIAGTREQGYHKPTPRGALVFLDAATQTETVEQIRTTSTSEWTDSQSIARRTRRRVCSRILRPVRLERRLRHPAAGRIQVIVTLDGATDRLADARYSTKGRCGSAEGTGIEAGPKSSNPSWQCLGCKEL